MKKITGLFLAICVFLTSCGSTAGEIRENGNNSAESIENVEDSQASSEITYSWQIEETLLPSADAELQKLIPEGAEIYGSDWNYGGDWKFVNDAVYRSVFFINSDYSVSDEELFKGCCIQILETPYQEWETYYIPQDEWLEGEKVYPFGYTYCTFAEDGTFFLLLESPEGEYIGKWKDGKCTCIPFEYKNIPGGENGMDFMGMGAETENELILYGYEKFVDVKLEQGEAAAETIDRMGAINRVIKNKYDDTIYYITAADSSLEREETQDGIRTNFTQSGLKITEQNGSVLLETEDIISGITDGVEFVSEDAGYIYQALAIAGFSLSDGQCEMIYDFWEDSYYYGKMTRIVDGYSPAENAHTLLVECRDGNYEIWNLSYGSAKADAKKVIEWAMGGSNGFFEQAVAEFNHQNTEYQVVLRKQENGESSKDFATRIQAEITAGGGPDLIEWNIVDAKNGLEQGYLLDITEEFADYESKMPEGAWNSGLLEGRRYGVLFSCTVTTLVTDKDTVGKLSGWSVQKATDCMENSGAECFIVGADEADLFYYMALQGGNSDLVDWDKGEAYFNGETAERLLKFSSLYADNSGKSDDKYRRLLEKDALAVIDYIYTPQAVKDTVAALNGEEAYVGFPAKEGAGVHVMSGYGISVNGMSKEKEGALEFIKFLLSDKTQGEIADKVKKNEIIGFPVTFNALDRVYDYLRGETLENEPLKNAGGVDFIPAELDENRVAMLKEMLETAQTLDRRNEVLYNIVEEEIRGYAVSGKSPAQVLDIVQNRAELYLNEQ